MGKHSRFAAECCFHKFFLRVEGRDFPECPATRRRWRFHPEPPMAFFLLYEYRPIPPLSRHHTEPVPEYSNVGGSHHLIAGQSVFHLYDQGCSVLSSWRQHMKTLIPKGAKYIFDQNRVTNITTLFSLLPTFRMYFWSEYKKQKEDIVNSILSFPIDACTNSHKETRFSPKSRKWI